MNPLGVDNHLPTGEQTNQVASRVGGIDTSMTSSNEIPREVRRLRNSLLSPKSTLRIANWNVRTLFQAGKLAQVTREFRDYGLNILGMSECRWPNSGKFVGASGETIYYSGRLDGRHESGVAIMVDKYSNSCLQEWKPISDRLISARFFSKFTKLTIVQAYAPTNNAGEAEKEEFYEQLQDVLQRIPRHDMVMLIGDFNAKVGSDNARREACMGRQGLGVMNENGQLFADLCMDSELVIGGTLFRHKPAHTYTWASPDGVTFNQIDHVAVSRRWVSSLQDVRAFHGADCGSDHNLVIAKVKLSLKRVGAKSKRSRLAVRRLGINEVKEEFNIKLSNRFAALEELDESGIEEYWAELKEGFKEVGEEVLGFEKSKKKPWVSDNSWMKVEQRRILKAKIDSANDELSRNSAKLEYSVKDREVKESMKIDRKKFIEDQAEEAERAAQRQDTRTLFQVAKSLSKKSFNVGGGQVKDQNGVILTSQVDQLRRWAEHFQQVLNLPEPANPAEVREPVEELIISIDPLSKEEIVDGIKGLKNNKAAGYDGIAAELLKADAEASADALVVLFSRIWLQEEVPEDWLRGLIVKLPKKGDLSLSDNWRGITLLCIICKVFAACLLNRLKSLIYRLLRREQAGFRPGHGCMDHIFVLRTILEESLQFNKPCSSILAISERPLIAFIGPACGKC